MPLAQEGDQELKAQAKLENASSEAGGRSPSVCGHGRWRPWALSKRSAQSPLGVTRRAETPLAGLGEPRLRGE